jgi:hypothetical protein
MGYDFKTITHITKSTFEADHPAELLEFKEKLQAVLGEGISFKTLTMHSLYVYRVGDIVPMGVISHEQLSTKYENSRWGENIAPWYYTVNAHTIQNMKYADYNDRRYSVSAKNVDKGVSNAVKYLRTANAKEMIEYSSSYVLRARSSIHSDLRRDCSRAESKAFKVTQVDPEILAYILRQAEHDPTSFSAELLGNIESYKVKKAEYEEAITGVPKWTYVGVVSKTAATPWVDYAELDINTYKNKLEPIGSSHIISRVPFTDLHEDTRAKIATLSMMEDSTYIEGLGYRLDEGAFYVQN